VSYHHENDQGYREQFERLCTDVIVSRSVDIGDIDPNANTEYVRQKIRDEYLRDATVTVVLIGKLTWQRKHVDWEIYSSLRDTSNNPRGGLIGILLPTYQFQEPRKYYPYTIPPRLYDNLKERPDRNPPFASIYLWSNNATEVQDWIHQAFLRRDKYNPINNRPMFGKNHSGDRWYD
jgi:hypothetical protein